MPPQWRAWQERQASRCGKASVSSPRAAISDSLQRPNLAEGRVVNCASRGTVENNMPDIELIAEKHPMIYPI
jgi:hypothetical protein